MDELSTACVAFFLFVMGAAFGSFINVLSDRLPREETILGRSHCENCKHILEWYDLIPIFSFLQIGGKCRYCKTKLSFYYPLSEIMTGLAFIVTWFYAPVHQFSNGVISPEIEIIIRSVYLIVISGMIVVFLSDLKTQIIPDSMQVVLLVCGIVLRLIEGHFQITVLGHLFIEGILVMVPILLLYVGTKGKGMGFGDVKLAFVIGVLFGLKLGFIILYLAFVFGAVAGVALIIKKKKKLKSKIAFGPYLILAMAAGLFLQPLLLAAIKRLWGV
jgi:prepilin signal peptidase PulO-like enzyme (type II secretory pathway)